MKDNLKKMLIMRVYSGNFLKLSFRHSALRTRLL